MVLAVHIAVAVFAVYLCLHYGIMKRSNLSGISKKEYLIGETSAFSVLCLVGGIVLLIVSGGLVPAEFSYFTAVFFSTYLCTYLTGNILPGLPLQILLFFLCLLALYALKKKADPQLTGNRMPLPKGAVAVLEEDVEHAHEEQSDKEDDPHPDKEAKVLPHEEQEAAENASGEHCPDDE